MYDWNMAYRGLYSYRRWVCAITLFPNIFHIISTCWASLQMFLKWKSDTCMYKQLICIMLCVHFQVQVGVFNCQQVLTKISFVIFDIIVKKQIECGLAWHWGNSTDLGLIDMVLTNLNAEFVACVLLLQKITPQAESGKYKFPNMVLPPNWGQKLAAFWSLWTLFSPAWVQPL